MLILLPISGDIQESREWIELRMKGDQRARLTSMLSKKTGRRQFTESLTPFSINQTSDTSLAKRTRRVKLHFKRKARDSLSVIFSLTSFKKTALSFKAPKLLDYSFEMTFDSLKDRLKWS
jgi:hypothetical protein